MRSFFAAIILCLCFSTNGRAQGVQRVDSLEDLVSEVSRDDLREIEKEYYKDKYKRGPVSTRVSESLLAKAKGRTWTLVFTKQDDRLMKGPGTSMWFSSEPNKDSFRVSGIQIYPNVTVYVEPPLLDKIKLLRPGRKFQVTGVISEVVLRQVTTKASQIRMVLGLQIQASDVGPAK